MRKSGVVLKFGIFLLLGIFCWVFSDLATLAASQSFSDLPQNPLYKSFIEDFQEQNVIVGYTKGGDPTGVLGARDYLKRSEFTKVATLIRLLEEAQDQGEADDYSDIDLDEFTLKTNTLLQPYYTSRPGAPKFSDVPEKEVTCAKDPGGCEPWYTQYVNYAASKGMIKGYAAANGSSYFDPEASILRIHALKLIIADNGNTSPENDARYQRLSSDPRIQGRVPRCLGDAQDEILLSNGGDNADSRNLLSYALLADKLDLFGNLCQAFEEAGATTPQKKADFLHSPITRQEIARYFALTTTYGPLMADLTNDTTTDTKEEYIIPLDSEWGSDETSQTSDERYVESPESSETNSAEPEITRLKQPLGDMTVSELAAIKEQGRCCMSTTTSSCKTIQYEDYAITEESELGEFTDGTALWNKAEKGSEICYIPFADIINGNQQCDITSADKDLIEKYTYLDYPLAVRQIWTSGHNPTFKMYMQIGLDYAIQNTKKINQLEKNNSCVGHQNLVLGLASGNAIAKLRFLSVDNNIFKNLTNLIL